MKKMCLFILILWGTPKSKNDWDATCLP